MSVPPLCQKTRKQTMSSLFSSKFTTRSSHVCSLLSLQNVYANIEWLRCSLFSKTRLTPRHALSPFLLFSALLKNTTLGLWLLLCPLQIRSSSNKCRLSFCPVETLSKKLRLPCYGLSQESGWCGACMCASTPVLFSMRKRSHASSLWLGV